jgi:hypothetical protein
MVLAESLAYGSRGLRQSTVPSRRVTVELLGPISIRGASRPFRRAWSLELVTYLALHPRGVDNGQWVTALWPDRVMAKATLHSVASAARRSLGVGPVGDHLPHAHGRLQLSETVDTDLSQLERLATSSDPQDWIYGLQLIRGRPLIGLRSADWPVTEGHLARIETVVVDLALSVGNQALNTGCPEIAIWAAHQGLIVSPYDERLFRLRFRAADAQGHPAGVESAMHELLLLLSDPEEWSGASTGVDDRRLDSIVHPQTATLYRSLSRGHVKPFDPSWPWPSEAVAATR